MIRDFIALLLILAGVTCVTIGGFMVGRAFGFVLLGVVLLILGSVLTAAAADDDDTIEEET